MSQALEARESVGSVFTNVNVFDGISQDLLTNHSVFVKGDRIVEVSNRPATPEDGDVIDGRGRTLMPGMIDAHIHAYFYDLNGTRMQNVPVTFYAHHAANMLGDMLDRGFTTVRDTGGADYGLWMAIEQGLITAPRLYYCGHALSQTGGHADWRHHHHYHPHDDEAVLCGCCFTNPLGIIVDGVDAIRRVTREELRRGASFIKICGSGGVSTVSDPLDSIQFSAEEVRAVVEEVENHLTYVTAHIHPDRALRRAIELGIHCIEHGTLVEEDTAKLAADSGTKIVPTMAVIHALAERGEELGYPKESLAKLDRVKDEAIDRMRHMKSAGVSIGFGTDLIGPLHTEQCIEFELRSNVFSNFEILVQATSGSAKIIRADDDVGSIRPGVYADILLVDGNPLEDLTLLMNDGVHIPLIMKGGRVHKDRVSSQAQQT